MKRGKGAADQTQVRRQVLREALVQTAMKGVGGGERPATAQDAENLHEVAVDAGRKREEGRMEGDTLAYVDAEGIPQVALRHEGVHSSEQVAGFGSCFLASPSRGGRPEGPDGRFD